MEAYKTLQLVTRAVCDETGCYGTSQDVAHVQAFLASADPAHSAERKYVSGMEFANFYAFNEAQFNKDLLWRAIEDAFGQALPQDQGWAFRSTLGDMAQYLSPLVKQRRMRKRTS